MPSLAWASHKHWKNRAFKTRPLTLFESHSMKFELVLSDRIDFAIIVIVRLLLQSDCNNESGLGTVIWHPIV